MLLAVNQQAAVHLVLTCLYIRRHIQWWLRHRCTAADRQWIRHHRPPFKTLTFSFSMTAPSLVPELHSVVSTSAPNRHILVLADHALTMSVSPSRRTPHMTKPVHELSHSNTLNHLSVLVLMVLPMHSIMMMCCRLLTEVNKLCAIFMHIFKYVYVCVQ